MSCACVCARYYISICDNLRSQYLYHIRAVIDTDSIIVLSVSSQKINLDVE